MSNIFVYRTYSVEGSADSVKEKLIQLFLSKGFKQELKESNTLFFHYPSIIFSSSRPLTCISHLSLEITEKNMCVEVRIGVNFKKIRYFTIIILSIICGVIPAVLGYYKNGVPDIPPVSYLGIPLGFMIHYHVRWRVFNALKRLVAQSGDNK